MPFLSTKFFAKAKDSIVGSKPTTSLFVPIEKYIDSWPVPHPTSKTFFLYPINFLNCAANVFLSPFSRIVDLLSVSL